MSVPDQTPFTAAVGNGVTTIFPFEFLTVQADDLVVSINGVDLANGAGYSVSGLGAESGGSVTFSTPPAVGAAVLIRRVIATLRDTDYQYQGEIPSDTLNNDFDRIWLALQGFLSQLTGAVRAPFPERLTVLPPASQRADKVLSFDSNGNPQASSPVSGSVLDFAVTLLSGTGASLVGFLQAGAGAIARTLASKAQESVTPQDFMTDAQKMNVFLGLGTIDVSDAFQKAADTGRPIWLPDGRYLKATPTTYTGGLVMRGTKKAVVLCDSTFLDVTSGDDSFVDGFTLLNITTPWVIARNPANWYAAPLLQQSNNDGCYQPTVNDVDIYASLTPAQKAQNIGPVIYFHGDAKRIRVSNIHGRFVTVALHDTQYSSILDCNFKAGRGMAGAYCWNINSQEGRTNRIDRNTIRDASNSGWMFARNFDGHANNNVVELCGESGGKFYQDTVAGKDAACYRMNAHNNTTTYAYYDGFDFSASYSEPVGTRPDTRHNTSGNDAYGCRQQGIYQRDGGQDNHLGGQLRLCGAGAAYFETVGSKIMGFHALGCVDAQHAGSNAFTVGGAGNTADLNSVNACPNAGYTIYAPGDNKVRHNDTDGPMFLGNPGSVLAKASGNIASNYSTDEHTTPLNVRQSLSSAAGYALQLYSEDVAVSTIRMVFRARRHLLANPIGSVDGILVNGTSGAESGRVAVRSAYGGQLQDALIAHEGRAAGMPFVITGSPNGAANGPNPLADLVVNQEVSYHEEGTPAKKIYVRFSNGAVYEGSIPLTPI